MDDVKVNNTQSANPSQGANEDIVSRVLKSSSVEALAVKQQDVLSDVEQTISKGLISDDVLSKIKDPIAKQFIIDKHKEMLAGMNKKFQELADLRKSVEDQKQQLLQSKPKYDIYTREGLQSALQDPEFTSLVQEYAQEVAPTEWQGSQEEWSGLNDREKSEFVAMKNEINQLKKTNLKNELSQIDLKLKEKYSDYDPTAIDSFSKDLNSGKYGTLETRELIFKALSFEKAIQRAYDIARKENSVDIGNKMNASSFDSSGNNGGSNPAPLERIQGEESKSYFKRLTESILSKQQLK